MNVAPRSRATQTKKDMRLLSTPPLLLLSCFLSVRSQRTDTNKTKTNPNQAQPNLQNSTTLKLTASKQPL